MKFRYLASVLLVGASILFLLKFRSEPPISEQVGSLEAEIESSAKGTSDPADLEKISSPDPSIVIDPKALISEEKSLLQSPETSVTMELTYIQKAQQLAERLKIIPMDQELLRLNDYQGLKNEKESGFFGMFQGALLNDEKNRKIRLNLSFTGSSSYDISGTSCFSVLTGDKVLPLAKNIDGQLKILRGTEEGYFVVSILDQFYLQIFQTTDTPRRSYRAFLSKKGTSKKYEVVLRDKGGGISPVPLTCENYW